MTEVEKAKNAVMWHLYTNGKRAKVKELLELPGHKREVLTRAINILGREEEIHYTWANELVRMTTR